MFRLATLAATLALSSTVSAVSSTVAYPQPSQSCVAGVHMIIARASTEPQSNGIIGGVSDMVMKMVPNSDVVSVVYPATEENYVFSEQEGVVGMKQLVTDYVSKCPNGKIALLGYSQGAQVVGDTVIGSDEKNFSDDTTNPIGLGTNYLNQIIAMIMMGDPAYVPGMPGSVGNSTKPGIFQRQNVDAFKKYGLDSKMQEYCDAGDTFCAGGGASNSLSIHLSYVATYGSKAAQFIADKAQAAGISVGGSSGSSGSASGAATSASAAATSAAATSKATSAAAGSVSTKASNNGPTSSAAGFSAAAAGGKSTSSINVLTSNRYHPYSGTFTGGTFGELGDLQANPGAIHTIEKGITGAVFGFAMFIMGML